MSDKSPLTEYLEGESVQYGAVGSLEHGSSLQRVLKFLDKPHF